MERLKNNLEKMLTISVGIPTYNQSKFIEKAIESVLNQTFKNIEIIVSDDSRNVDTETILQNYIANKQIKYFKNIKTIGRVANYRKILFQYSSSDLHINLDGDDYFTNVNFIKNAIQEIGKINFDKFLFYQGSHIYKTNTEERTINPKIENDNKYFNGDQYFFNFFKISHFSHMSTIYNRKEAISSDFYKKNIISSDIFSFLKVAVTNPFDTIILSKNISGVWLQHGDNASGNKNFIEHLKNFNLYTSLFLLQLKHHPKKAFGWFAKSIYVYWVGYLKNIFR